MIKKITVMFVTIVLLATIAPVSLADSGGQKHYNGLVGADSPLYGLKVGFQNLDLALTFNNTEKLKKQMNLADERVAEYQDAVEEENIAAMDAAADQYSETLDDIAETSEAPDVDQGVYSELVVLLYHHKEVFMLTADEFANLDPSDPLYGTDPAAEMTYYVQGHTVELTDQIIKMKNGMPFYYYNGEQYFIPPGQVNKLEPGTVGSTIVNGSKVPPGLKKKGYKEVYNIDGSLSIDNASKTWPWDQIDYKSNTKTHGNGNGNGNGNNKNK